MSFDPRFRNQKEHFFYHTINPIKATLNVRLLGPNLAFAFGHKRPENISPSAFAATLACKTIGLLILRNVDQRLVLKWAESGHGSSKNGDMQIHAPHTLSNKTWARRAATLAETMGMSITSTFDGCGISSTDPNLSQLHGAYFGSHVEVKLATYAVVLLFRMFGYRQDKIETVTIDDLRNLRDRVWENGMRPCFEIELSKKPCGRCVKFVNRLQRLTGVTFYLLARQRLVDIEYQQQDICDGFAGNTIQDDTVSVCSEFLPDETREVVDISDTESTSTVVARRPRKEKKPKEPVPDVDVLKPFPATPVYQHPSFLSKSAARRIKEWHRKKTPYLGRHA